MAYDELLGFDPATEKRDAFHYVMTPEKAAYILDECNNDNRPFSSAQARRIRHSVNDVGYIWDGDPIRFNTNGHLTEGQHRLTIIRDQKITAELPVVTGVLPDHFTEGAEAKKRTAACEIGRKYPEVLSSQIAVLGDIVKRRHLEKLTLQNAIFYWELYSDNVVAGCRTIDDFMTNVSEYSHFARNFGSWAALMNLTNQDETATEFLDYLKEEIVGRESYALTKNFCEFFKQHSDTMANSQRSTFMFQLLCHATDMLIKSKHNARNHNGRAAEILLERSIASYNHKSLRQNGTYRKFLADPRK